MLWPEQRQADLTQKIQRLVASPVRRYCYLHSTILHDSLPKALSENPHAFEDTDYIVGPSWQQVEIKNSYDAPCFYVLTAHGSDISELIWGIRAKAHRDSVFAIWFWDNHVAYNDNYKTALAADLCYISHNISVPGYLTNPVSAVVEHIPACCAQFGRQELTELVQNSCAPRTHKAIFNYVIYDKAPRSQLIHALSHQLNACADFKLMESHDRNRYWGQTRNQRVSEWTSYKSSVILPLVNDLSTRVFDALATGQVPVIPDNVHDLDNVIPPHVQQDLGIVRFHEFSPQAIEEAIGQALNEFDRQGHEGVIKRSKFVSDFHMVGHRIHAMLHSITAKQYNPIFGTGALGLGVYAR
jgi:hypothetical protein